MLENTKKALDAFGKKVVRDSKSNLTRQRKNVSKKLYNSIRFSSRISDRSLELEFQMEKYGMYQDEGVHGKLKKQNKKFIYRKNDRLGFRYRDKRPPASAFDRWGVQKGISPRNAQGQFIKRKALNFAIAKGIYEKGIKPSGFFSRPFEKEFKELPEELIEAFGLDIERLLQISVDNGTTTNR